MAKTLELAAAEREANEIGKKFAFSNDVMADMSKAYHTDFSDINIHTDAAADAKVKGAGKDAIASGRDIYFGAGIYESKDPASKGLVAHELAHTMQQDGQSAGVSEHAPQGAEQGGILDVFKNLFGRKKPKIEFLGAQKDTSDEAKQYMWLMNVRAGQERNKKLRQARQNTAGIVGRRVNVNQASPEVIAANRAARVDAVKDSNASWNSKEGSSERHNASSAYREFGYRTNRKVSKTDRAERGAMFGNILEQDPSKMTGFSKQLKDYFDAVMDTGFRFDDDMEEYDAINPKSVGGKASNFTQFSKNTAGEFLTMLSGYLESEEGVRYITDFYNGVKDADVFQQGQNTSPMAFVLQTIMNSEASRLQHVASGVVTERHGTQRDMDVARSAVGKGSGALLMKLAALADKPDEYAQLPADIRVLLDQYNALLTRLEGRVGANL